MKKLSVLKNCKGQSIIEVVIALSLITIAMMGVVSLAVTSLALLLDSRDKTEAVSYAQKFLEEKKGSRSNSCSGIIVTAGSPGQIDTSKYYQDVDVTDPDSTLTDNPLLVTVTISWPSKGSATRDRSIVLSELINVR